MRKSVIRVVALCALSAMTITSYPTKTVFATSAADLLPTEGAILATGEGVSLKDIKAELARSLAKQKAQSIRSALKAENGNSENTETKNLTASTKSDIDISIKAETPASKAVKDSATANGTSVVGSAASAAAMTISDTDDGMLDEVPSENGTVSQNEINENKDPSEGPSIEVSLASDDVAEGEQDLSKMIIAQVSYYVNVRETPSEDGEIVGKLYNNSAGEWLDKDGDWYKIKSGSVTGYVKGEFVVSGQAAVELAAEVGERVAVVTTTTLKVREEASTESAVLGLVPIEDRLTVTEETDEWVKVSIEEGDGWVSKEFVTVSTEFPKAESKAEEEARLKKEEAARKAANAAAAKAAKKNGTKAPTGGGGGNYSAVGSGMGAAVANYALQFVGNPYVYGGTSLTNGTDCSGFTMGVYRNFGVSLPHSSGAQRGLGYSVGGLANAQAGDIVCYSVRFWVRIQEILNRCIYARLL